MVQLKTCEHLLPVGGVFLKLPVFGAWLGTRLELPAGGTGPDVWVQGLLMAALRDSSPHASDLSCGAGIQATKNGRREGIADGCPEHLGEN